MYLPVIFYQIFNLIFKYFTIAKVDKSYTTLLSAKSQNISQQNSQILFLHDFYFPN